MVLAFSGGVLMAHRRVEHAIPTRRRTKRVGGPYGVLERVSGVATSPQSHPKSQRYTRGATSLASSVMVSVSAASSVSTMKY
jgi:hypothetical protein